MINIFSLIPLFCILRQRLSGSILTDFHLFSWANSCPWRAVGKDSFREATIIRVRSWINNELLYPQCLVFTQESFVNVEALHMYGSTSLSYSSASWLITPGSHLCKRRHPNVSHAGATVSVVRPVADCGMCVSCRRCTTPVLSSFTSGSSVPPSMTTTTSAWWMWTAGCASSSAATLQPSAWSSTGSSLRWTYTLYPDYCCWNTMHNAL